MYLLLNVYHLFCQTFALMTNYIPFTTILVSHVLTMEAVHTTKVVFLFLYKICYDEAWNYRGYRKEFKCPMLSFDQSHKRSSLRCKVRKGSVGLPRSFRGDFNGIASALGSV